MYRLRKLSCSNVIGFVAGLGQKNFELDLSDEMNHSMFVIVGKNGGGKSVLMSLIHPTAWPSDGRNHFIVEGKAGTVFREYVGDDGTVINVKCFYKPKKDKGHSVSCYFEIVKPNGEPEELNPNGNVTSFNQLVQTYFGINKDFISFASFSSSMASIIKMTDQERKDSVSTMTPNVKRFEVAYDILNEKYKNLRNLIRNVSQKILSLRDETSLEADFSRLNSEMKRYTEEREEQIKKLSKIEGRLKELTGGADVDDLVSRYNQMLGSLSICDAEIDSTMSKLLKVYEALGIETSSKGTISFPGMDNVAAKVLHYEKKLALLDGNRQTQKSRREKLEQELHRTEKEIGETESMLYGIQEQDPKALEATREEYLKRLSELKYTKVAKDYEDKNYDEAVALSRSMVTLQQMIESLYENYGELVTEYFADPNWVDYGVVQSKEIDRLTISFETTSAKRDQLYRKIVEHEQYRHLREVLAQRPRNCTIDSCPFIANALKWGSMADEIAELKEEYRKLELELTETSNEREMYEHRIAIHGDAQKLVKYLETIREPLRKYLSVDDFGKLFRAISNGTWGEILDIMKLKSEVVILSEKQLYLQIVNMRLPEVEHALELAKLHGANKDLLMHQLDRLKESRADLKNELQELAMHLSIGKRQKKIYERRLELWSSVSKGIEEYRTLIATRLETQEKVDDQGSKIQTITDLRSKLKEKRALIGELDDLIKDRYPKLQQISMDLDSLRRLKIEKAEIERNFMVINIIRTIVSPGKGIRKELINIYMDEIKEIANQLLLNTFDGSLYLEDFIITDKEFTIPYVVYGSIGTDISYASASQQSAIASALSLAILSRIISNYGIATFDEIDAPLNPKNKSEFLQILTKQAAMIGLNQVFIVTHSAEHYIPYDVCFIAFPGAELDGSKLDIIDVGAVA